MIGGRRRISVRTRVASMLYVIARLNLLSPAVSVVRAPLNTMLGRAMPLFLGRSRRCGRQRSKCR